MRGDYNDIETTWDEPTEEEHIKLEKAQLEEDVVMRSEDQEEVTAGKENHIDDGKLSLSCLES